MCDPVISKFVKNLQSHSEEPAKPASRRMATGTAEQAAILRDARNRNRLLPISILLLVAEVGQARLRGALLRMRSELFCVLSALLLLPLGAGAAQAHALLDHADPRVGNTVKSPRMVSLWFTQNLENAFSTIEVLDSTGTRMNVGKASVDANDRRLLRVPVKVLPSGTYTVKWHVLSVDTHTTEGNFAFHVAP